MPSLIEYIKEVFRKLDENHFKILSIVERNLSRYEIVPKEVILSESGFGRRGEKLLKKLHEYKLIWAPMGLERGFCINYNGLDLLALKSLADRNVIQELGRPLGVGKEADVYDALTPRGERVAVKFFRIGRTSFKRYEKHRTSLVRSHGYLAASMKAAEMEYKALKILYPRGVKVPRPIARSRHVIVTSFFQGIELASIQNLENPVQVLGNILVNVKQACDARIVHSDLSAYNVLITPTEDILIIDWPQWVSLSHPMAQTYLRRDLSHLIKFFRRKWKIREIPEEYLKIVEELCGESFLM